MAKEAAEDERVISYLTQALNTIDRARALTRQLLTFAKGGAPIPKTDRLFPFIEETVKFALSGANVSPRFNIPGNLWLCSFDKNQIGQVIDNLVINAQQAMPVGGTIEVSACNVTLADKEHPVLNRGKYVKISIKDTGIGIPQELLSRIFDPFFTTKTRGHGLGLATCFSIVSRHEGSISVESEPSKGTTFHIYLPASDKEAPKKTAELDAVHHGSGVFLVMDDEEVMRDILTVMLGNFGYTVHCTQDGKEAVSYFLEQTTQGNQIKGMIFDLTVPGGMGGKEAIEEIRNSNTDIPAFVSSGYADDPVMTSPSEYGFTASICKPYNKKELSKMLKKYLNRVLK
jgi:CheY-like chemotaxis protein